MDLNFITPIQPWSSINTENTYSLSGGDNQGGMFRKIFENAVNDVEETEKNLV